jgi:hypothetical protein
MTEPYCGVGKMPKGYRRGTMRECVDMKQIRYYGLKKVDSRLIESSKNTQNIENERKKLVIKRIKAKAKIKGMIADIKTEKDIDKKNKMKKEAINFVKKLKEISSALKKVDILVQKKRHRDMKKKEKKVKKEKKEKKTENNKKKKKKK